MVTETMIFEAVRNLVEFNWEYPEEHEEAVKEWQRLWGMATIAEREQMMREAKIAGIM
jgi:hypothetical protein